MAGPVIYLHRNSGDRDDQPAAALPACPPLSPMKPSTDYIRHAAKLARKLQMDAAMGSTAQPDAEFYKTLAKALEEIAAGLEQVATRE
jgi:hypothetical protein